MLERLIGTFVVAGRFGAAARLKGAMARLKGRRRGKNSTGANDRPADRNPQLDNSRIARPGLARPGSDDSLRSRRSADPCLERRAESRSVNLLPAGL